MAAQFLRSRSAWSRVRFACLTALLAIITAGAVSATASAEEPDTVTSPAGHEMAAGEVIVGFTAGSTSAERSSSLNAVDAESSDPMALPRTRVVELGEGVSIGEAIGELESRAGVRYAEPNFLFELNRTPNDDLYSYLWGMKNVGQNTNLVEGGQPLHGTPGVDINAEAAWDIFTGTSNTRVAVIDGGLAAKNYDLAYWEDPHPDLINVTNQELSRNFTRLEGEENPPPPDPDDWFDLFGHGTHVAGTITGQGNNSEGIAGVNWDSDLVGLRVCRILGCLTNEIVDGIVYAGDIDSRVANMSLGGTAYSQAMRDALAAAPDTLYVAAAGNGNLVGNEDGDNVDTYPHYPCAYNLPNVLCVAAHGIDGPLTPWSNFGTTGVDIAAPGLRIVSAEPVFHDEDLAPEDTLHYVGQSGTSMAAPHVSGAATLAFSAKPEASVAEVRRAILNSAKPDPSLTTKVATGGRLDARGTLDELLNASQCTLPNGTQYRTLWRAMPNATFDIVDVQKRASSSQSWGKFVDYWGDVAKTEWWTPDTLSNVFTQPGAWGDWGYTVADNAWSYAASYAAVDQRTDVLATSPFGFLAPRVSYRTNGSGTARDADVCNNFLGSWPTIAGKRTFITGDSMVTQMAKKFMNQTGWKVKVEPQSRSSYATMRGDIRGIAAGLSDPSSFGDQAKPETIVITLGTRDADAIGAIANATQRTAALNTFKSNVDGVLADTSAVQCRVLTTVHETGWKADGSYSAEQLQARKDVNAKLRAVASASSSVDLVDWQALSAGHEASKPAGTRWYEPTDRDNPNAAGLTALSNAIITEAQGSCS